MARLYFYPFIAFFSSSVYALLLLFSATDQSPSIQEWTSVDSISSVALFVFPQ